jgi:hypothetical protein
MRRQITLSIALVVSVVLLSLMSSGATARAQNQLRPVADTGILTLGPNQVLRVTVAAGDLDGDTAVSVRIRRMGYIEEDNLYKIASQTTSDRITLMPGEGALMNVTDGMSNTILGVRAVVLSNSRNVRVTGQIIDTATGQVNSVLIAILLP